MKIRKAILKDLDAIVYLLDQYQQLEYKLDKSQKPDSLKKLKKITSDLFKHDVQFTVIEEEDKLVGVANWEIRTSAYGNSGVLHNLFILSSQRGKGLGKKLLSSIYKEFKKAHCSGIRTFVRPKNKTSQQFWKKQGYHLELGYYGYKKL